MMNPGSNYMMMRMRQAMKNLEEENKLLKQEIADLKSAGAKSKPKAAFADVPAKQKPVVKKLDLDDSAETTKE